MGEKHSAGKQFGENSICLKTISELSSDFQMGDMIYTDLVSESDDAEKFFMRPTLGEKYHIFEHRRPRVRLLSCAI